MSDPSNPVVVESISRDGLDTINKSSPREIDTPNKFSSPKTYTRKFKELFK